MPDVDTAQPEPAAPFRPLDVPVRLWVPLATRPPFAAIRLKPAGSAVAPGEPLTESNSEAAPVPLSPVAGRIIETARVTLTNTHEAPAVLIEPDAAQQPLAIALPVTDEQVAAFLDPLGPTDLPATIDRLRRAGVWADRWTSPDLLGQLHQALRRPVDTVVCGVLDADPSLPVNRASAEAFGAEVVAGVGALAKLTGARGLWVAVDEAEPPVRWEAVRSAAAEAVEPLRIVPLENDYPQADPTLLLYTLTRRRLRPGRLPTEAGALLLDAAAAVAVGRALLAGEPMLRVPLAVYDHARAATHLVSVAVGTPLRHVLRSLDVHRAGLDLRAGGPLRERRVTGDAVVAGGELGVFALARAADVNPDPCVRCGWCVEGCPTRIHPAGLLEAAQQDDPSLAEHYGIHSCIECGICSYVCPSRLPLLQSIRALKARDRG